MLLKKLVLHIKDVNLHSFQVTLNMTCNRSDNIPNFPSIFTVPPLWLATKICFSTLTTVNLFRLSVGTEFSSSWNKFPLQHRPARDLLIQHHHPWKVWLRYAPGWTFLRFLIYFIGSWSNNTSRAPPGGVANQTWIIPTFIIRDLSYGWGDLLG